MPTPEQLLRQLVARQNKLEQIVKARPRSITDEIDAIPGRRIFYNLVGRDNFVAQQQGLRADAINFLVSQDGPFIMTHYPLVMWRPNLPTTATNFGEWSPVSAWPLPTQQVGVLQDRINLSYEIVDGGSQRNFQNEDSPAWFSRPDNAMPLPVPTLFSPNTTVQFFPTYERIIFAVTAIPTVRGEIVINLPGYRIVNL